MNLLVSRLKQFFIFLFFALIFINVSDVKADSHDQLSESLKQSLTIVINENVSEDLQKAIAKYAIAISQNISDKNEKKTLLQSTKEMLAISSNENINEFDKVYYLLANLETIIDIIYPHILNEMDNQNISNDLQINAWLAFSDLQTGIKNLLTGKNFDQSQIKNSLKVISKALVADSITETNQEVAEKETETDNTQNNENINANYNIDDKKEVIAKVQKSGKKGLTQTVDEEEEQLRKRDKVKTNSLLTCRESSTGCQFILPAKTSFYLKNNTKIIINSYSVDADGTQFIKACLLEGGFFYKTLRKTNSEVIINIKNEDEEFYDAIISQGTDAKLGVRKEKNYFLNVVNAGGTNVSKYRFFSENADTKQQNINISNVDDLKNMFNAPVNNILPSITNNFGDPCINPNFGDISTNVQETNTSKCTHAHAHNENDEFHDDEYDVGNYDLGENCNADIVIPEVVCSENWSCTLGGNDPKKDPNVNPDPDVDPGGDHHEGG